MATKRLDARVILSLFDDTGESPAKGFDETLSLSSFLDVTPGRRLTLAASADDQAFTFTSGAFLVIYSHTNSFKVRMAAGETLMSNLRLFGPVMVGAATNNALSTSVLLSGNGSTTADLEIWVVEKYTA